MQGTAGVRVDLCLCYFRPAFFFLAAAFFFFEGSLGRDFPKEPW